MVSSIRKMKLNMIRDIEHREEIRGIEYWEEYNLIRFLKRIQADKFIQNQDKFPIGKKCYDCGETANNNFFNILQRHHIDYNKPDKYVTLCRGFHSVRHLKYV